MTYSSFIFCMRRLSSQQLKINRKYTTIKRWLETMGILHKKISGNILLFFNAHQTAPENPIVHLWRGGKAWLLILQTNISKEYIHPGPHFNPHYESINHAFMFQLIGCSRQETRSPINIIFLYLKLLHKVLMKHVKFHKMSSLLSMT